MTDSELIASIPVNGLRWQKALNEYGSYIASTGEAVETYRSLILRLDQLIQERWGTTVARGDWQTGVVYNINDLVKQGDVVYQAIVAHTATTFAADLTAKRWKVYQDRGYKQISILELGGAGDYNVSTGAGTNNFFPLLNYTRLFNDCPTVHFPFVTGETNVYYFNYETIYGFGPNTVRITADKGVKFKCVNVGFDANGKDAIEIIPNIEMGFTYMEGDTFFGQPLSDKERHFVGAGDLIRNKFRKVDVASEFTSKRYAWPGSPSAGGTDLEVYTGSPIISYNGSTISFDGTGDGYYHVSEVRLKVGDRMHAYVTIPSGSGALTPACFARTALGFYGMTWAGGGAIGVEKEGGKGYANPILTHPQDNYRTLHATFDPSQAIVTIIPTTSHSFDVLVNGALFMSKTVRDPIQAYGVGGYTAGNPSGVKWEIIGIESGAAQNSTGLMGLFYIGDSRQADGPSCPGRWAAKYIDGSMGMRVSQYRNQAVGGNSSGNQLQILQANGVPPGTTDTVIAVITNDQQGAIPVQQAYDNTKAMIALCKAANSRVVLDLYPLWYTQAQAGARGQASLRYDIGNPYRAAIMQLAAEEDVVVVDGLSEYGLIIANMVNPNTDPNLTWMDPVIADNIHGNPTLGRLQGWAHAKAILGQINKVNTNETSWLTMPSVWSVQNGYSLVAGKSNKFRIAPNADVGFKLELNVGASRADGTQVFGAGRLLTPDSPLEIPAYTNTHERGSLVVAPDGGFRIYGFGATSGTILRADSGLYSTIY